MTMKKLERIDWKHYALELAKVAAKRSEDPYLKVGAAFLRKDNSVAGLRILKLTGVIVMKEENGLSMQRLMPYDMLDLTNVI